MGWPTSGDMEKNSSGGMEEESVPVEPERCVVTQPEASVPLREQRPGSEVAWGQAGKGGAYGHPTTSFTLPALHFKDICCPEGHRNLPGECSSSHTQELQFRPLKTG